MNDIQNETVCSTTHLEMGNFPRCQASPIKGLRQCFAFCTPSSSYRKYSNCHYQNQLLLTHFSLRAKTFLLVLSSITWYSSSTVGTWFSIKLQSDSRRRTMEVLPANKVQQTFKQIISHRDSIFSQLIVLYFNKDRAL